MWEYINSDNRYDYDAPLNESGDPTGKYYVMRDVIGLFSTLPPGPVPAPSSKANYGAIGMTEMV